jgi:hypothetical protein
MKTTLAISLFFGAFILKTQAQTNFEKGYITTANNEKKACFIKNLDWKNNPTELSYKINLNDEKTLTTSINEVLSFEVFGKSKFIKTTVNIDVSPINLNNLDTKRAPNFEKKTVFLKVLVEGETSLLSYKKNNLVRYFYKKEGKTEQLIYKKFYTPSKKVAVNTYYQQQLLNIIGTCSTASPRNVQSVKYKTKSLVNFFLKNYNCNSKFTSFISEEEKGQLAIVPNIGFGSHQISTKNSANSSRDFDFDSELSLRVGVEVALTLPFNNKKWSVFTAPTYQSYSTEKSKASSNVSGGIIKAVVDYSSLEVPFGVKHYFFLSKESKLFLSGAYIFDIPLNGSITYKRADNSILDTLKIGNISSGFGIGAGVNYSNYSLGIRYTSRNITPNNVTLESNYSALSFNVGYTF